MCTLEHNGRCPVLEHLSSVSFSSVMSTETALQPNENIVSAREVLKPFHKQAQELYTQATQEKNNIIHHETMYRCWFTEDAEFFRRRALEKEWHRLMVKDIPPEIYCPFPFSRTVPYRIEAFSYYQTNKRHEAMNTHSTKNKQTKYQSSLQNRPDSNEPVLKANKIDPTIHPVTLITTLGDSRALLESIPHEDVLVIGIDTEFCQMRLEFYQFCLFRSLTAAKILYEDVYSLFIVYFICKLNVFHVFSSNGSKCTSFY